MIDLIWDQYEQTIRESVREAKAITWDRCHKIYVLMDEEQVQECRDFGYDPIIPTEDQVETAMSHLRRWYSESCNLRFINAVETNHTNPNAGFTDLIPQGAEWEQEED